MRELFIGKSNIKVPYVGLGTWAIGGGSWWGNNDDDVSVATIRKAHELGIKWIDTAPIYGLYHSEEVVGKAIKPIRDEVVLSTKCALEWRHETPVLHKCVDGTNVYRDLSAKSIIEDVEHSLITLNTDYIDVLYTHWQSPSEDIFPIEETCMALDKLKRDGKIRAIGASNVTPWHIEQYEKYCGLDVIQEKYSIMTRRIEQDLYPVCKKYNVSIQAYSPLEQGLLTGKVTMETTYPQGDVRNNNKNFAPDRRAMALSLLEKWKPLCEKYDCSVGNLVIAITGNMIRDLHVLCGARTLAQIEENARALNISLSVEDIKMMTEDINEVLAG